MSSGEHVPGTGNMVSGSGEAAGTGSVPQLAAPKPSRRPIIIGGIVAGAVLLGGAIFAAISAFGGGGAANPTELAERVIVAAAKGNLSDLGELVAPSEEILVANLFSAGAAFAENQDDIAGVDFEELLSIYQDNVEVTLDNLQWQEVPLVPGEVVRVRLTGGTVTVDGDQEELKRALMDAVESGARAQRSAGGLMTEEQLDELIAQLRHEIDESVLFPLILDASDPLFKGAVVAVHEEGRWYFSGLLSALDYGVTANWSSYELGTSVVDGVGSPDPGTAVQDFLAAALSGDTEEFVSRFPLAERRALSIYAPGDWLAYLAPEAVLSDASFRSDDIRTQGSQARIYNWVLSWIDRGRPVDVDAFLCFDGTFCSLSPEMAEVLDLEDGIPLSLVREEGGWYFAPLVTLTHLLSIVAPYSGEVDDFF